jgi:gamma-glutamyltranspeptidase/glutathione hydrolase
MAATSHTTATLAAVDILRSGGNAMDAAVAACAVQNAVEAGSTGIGGDCFALLSRGGSENVIAYNGSGRTPSAASADWYERQGITVIERNSPHAVTVPGAVEAWARLIADHGRMQCRWRKSWRRRSTWRATDTRSRRASPTTSQISAIS